MAGSIARRGAGSTACSTRQPRAGCRSWSGVGGNDTRKAVKAVKRLQRHPVQGVLSVCPYYNRPSQDGMREHFTRIAEATNRPILIYNIPYRTGVNLTNETLLRLAEIPEHRGREGLLRQHPAVPRAAAPAARRLRGAHRRGRVLLHDAGPRRPTAASSPRRTSRPRCSSPCTSAWPPTTTRGRARPGHASSRWCRCSSRSRTRCRSSTA